MESQREVNPLHSRYIDLTARYKASWTFHRFLDGLQRFFGSSELGDLAFDFPSLYKSLKEASIHLNAGAPGRVEEDLEAVSKRLGEVVEALDEQDRRVSPSYLRLFFQRIRKYDERILIEMLRFYQEVQRDRTWDADRIDKVDFLVSRLAENVAGADLRGDRSRLAKVLDRLSGRLPLELADGAKVSNRLKLLSAVRTEIAQLERFEELASKDVVGHYRRLKHSLGMLFFERRILPVVVEANSMLAERIRLLVRQEEERIFTEYERISKLERDRGLGGRVLDAVARLRQQIEGFQRRVKAGTYRIDDLTRLSDSLEELHPMLEAEGAGEGMEGLASPPHGLFEGPAATASTERDVAPAIESPGTDRVEARVLEAASIEREAPLAAEIAELRRVVAAAGEEVSPEAAASDGLLLEWRVAPRQVSAFRRLASGEARDLRLEEFLTSVAATRLRIRRELERVRSRDEPGRETNAVQGLEAVELGDWCLAQFPHYVERSACGPDPADVRPLRRLRVELMHDYSELWLELFSG